MNKEQLKQWRERLGLSVPQMARYVGVSYATYNSWEKGDRKASGSGLQLIKVLTMVETMCPLVHEQLLDYSKGVE